MQSELAEICSTLAGIGIQTGDMICLLLYGVIVSTLLMCSLCKLRSLHGTQTCLIEGRLTSGGVSLAPVAWMLSSVNRWRVSSSVSTAFCFLRASQSTSAIRAPPWAQCVTLLEQPDRRLTGAIVA